MPDIDENDEKFADVDENTILFIDKKVPFDHSVKNYPRKSIVADDSKLFPSKKNKEVLQSKKLPLPPPFSADKPKFNAHSRN